ncbi:MAG: rhomboid family intramembrane serine protease [Cytophagales bacterium]|nr:rhomboid family intramembrane serine protease [Bernardetiaceae bacterium]MDW8209617.1 rhomboid family intramembrane serine protease [Cytophagales bacterium]
MNSFVQDFKIAWNKQNSGLSRLIIINVAVFVVLNLAIWTAQIFDFASLAHFFHSILYIPAPIEEFIWRPWTLVTYFFTHQNFFHILFNMLMLYWFGMISDEFMGSKRTIALYVYGGIVGGLLYLLVYNTIPFFYYNMPAIGMIGASASVYAIITGVATLTPEYRIYLLLFGPVKLKYLAAITIFLSFIGSSGSNAGGNIAHLGGALLGFVFVKLLQRGRDLSIPLNRFLWFFPNSWHTLSTRFGKRARNARYHHSSSRGERAIPSQEEIDRILDKISASGYESLTKEEKQTLFRYSESESQRKK